MNDYGAIVREAAQELNLLDSEGLLAPLDSFSIVELLVSLERRLGRRIPVAGVGLETFGSLEAVNAMLERLDRG